MRPVSRRTFLAWAVGGGGMVAAAALIVTVVAVFRLRPVATAPVIRLSKRLSDLAEGDVIPIRAPANWALLMADGGGANRTGNLAPAAFLVRTCGKTAVLAATCSHLGCTLAYHSDRSRFECPCHGSTYEPACAPAGRSTFAVDGTVVHGPAAFPMAHIKWKASAEPNELILDMVPAVPQF